MATSHMVRPAGALFSTRSARALLLVTLSIGTVAAATGVAADIAWLGLLGLLAIGAGLVVLAKLVLETRTLATSTGLSTRTVESQVDRLSAELRECRDVASAQRAVVDRLRRDVDRATAERSAMRSSHESVVAAIDALELAVREMQAAKKSLTRANQGHDKRIAAVEGVQAAAGDRVATVEEAHAATELAVSENRRLLEKVIRRTIRPRADAGLGELGSSKVTQPTLSIAIPSYNRPEFLAECLASVERGINEAGRDDVEVCITDDASSDPDTFDVLSDFARRNEFAALRANSSNLGLDRNLVESCVPCRGDYLLVLGNDDRLIPGALREILADIESGAASVYLYERRRMTRDGRPRERIKGTTPIEIPAGAAQLFPTVVDAVRPQGIISTLGFISTVVFRTTDFLAIEPDPYIDLTMYPLVFMLLEAFSAEQLQFRNLDVVVQRSLRQSEKRAESMGKSEEPFMRGGDARSSRYFGTTLAASLQRLADRATIDIGVFAELPERFLTKLSLVEWISNCRELDPQMDATLDPAVVADADRFFSGLMEMRQHAD